jgi:predicted kinase
MKEVIILRGIPGAGKTTYAKRFHPKAIVVSADDYFIDPKTRTYNFQRHNLRAAHRYCWHEFVNAIARGAPEIVVDNTNIKVREFKPYYDYATAHDYQAKCVFISSDPIVAAGRNLHNLSLEKVLQRFKQLEHDPNIPEWVFLEGELRRAI